MGGELQQRYAVPLAHTDLPPSEALHQLFDNLAHLEAVSADVFARLSARVAEERAKVGGIVRRVDACRQRVEKVGESQSRATTVYSTTKYPAPRMLTDFERVNPAASDAATAQASAPAAAAEVPVALHGDRHVPAAERVVGGQPANTTHLFARLTRPPDSDFDIDMREGLGRLPSYLPSISSALLFNSGENPYQKYVSLDNLEGIGGQDREKEARELAQAPSSLVDGAVLPQFAPPQMVYQPDPGQVPTFDLPDNLPLAQLADIRFDMDASKHLSIAPSVGIANLPTLPSAEDFSASTAGGGRREPRPAAPAAAAPAPPAPPAATPDVHLGGASSSVPAPPPAPPVPTPPPAAPRAPGPPPPGPGGGATKPPAGRASLLDSIRNPQIKLRKVTDKVIEEKRLAKSKAAASGGGGGGGGDMMSALKSMLAMRRSATAGKDDPAGGGAGGKAKADVDAEEFGDDDWE